MTLDEEALQESEKAKPTSDPNYWAKRSCNKCYGRGIIGNISRKVDTNTVVQQLLCQCADRNFGKWRDAWITEYKKTHPRNTAISEVDTPPTVVDNQP